MSYLTQVLFFVQMRGADNAANVYPGPDPIGAGNFQELISPQAQMQFAVIFVRFTPQKRTCAVHSPMSAVQLGVSALGQ